MSDTESTVTSAAVENAENQSYSNNHFIQSKRNAESFVKSNILFDGLNSKENNGVIEITPAPAVRNAITGKAHIGINQLLLQKFFKDNNINENEVITFHQAKKAGTFIKKGSKCFTITTPAKKLENGKWENNMYTYFPKSAAYNQDAIETYKLTVNRYKDIAYVRKQLETNPNNESLEKNLAYLHRDNFFASVIKTTEINEGKKDLMNDKNYREEFLSSFNKYMKKIPENEKKLFGKYVVKGEVNNNSLNVVLDQYTSEGFEKYCASKARKNEQFKLTNFTKDAVIDAKNLITIRDYAGKYLAASTLGGKLITDNQTLEAVAKDLNKQAQIAFEENKFSQIFTIGNDANVNCQETLRTFRSMSIEQQKGIEREISNKQPEFESTVDMVF